MQFTETIRSIKSSLPAAVINQPVTATVAYHGQLLEVDDEYSYEPPDLTGIMMTTSMTKPEKELDGWFVGKLKCKRHIDDSYRDTISSNNSNNNINSNSNSNTGDGRRVDDYAIIDPRKK